MLALPFALLAAAAAAGPTGTEEPRMLELRTLLTPVSYDEAKRRASRQRPDVSVTAEVSDTRINVTAVIGNPGKEAMSLGLKDAAYAIFEPFAAYLSTSEEVRRARVDAEHPSVPESFYVVELPARSQARVTYTIDLRDYRYRGSPTATIEWHLSLVGPTGRDAAQGQIPLKLPSRWLW